MTTLRSLIPFISLLLSLSPTTTAALPPGMSSPKTCKIPTDNCCNYLTPVNNVPDDDVHQDNGDPQAWVWVTHETTPVYDLRTRDVERNVNVTGSGTGTGIGNETRGVNVTEWLGKRQDGPPRVFLIAFNPSDYWPDLTPEPEEEKKKKKDETSASQPHSTRGGPKPRGPVIRVWPDHNTFLSDSGYYDLNLNCQDPESFVCNPDDKYLKLDFPLEIRAGAMCTGWGMNSWHGVQVRYNGVLSDVQHDEKHCHPFKEPGHDAIFDKVVMRVCWFNA